MQFHEWGKTQKMPFKVTLNGVGVSLTFATGDVKLSVDGAAAANVDVASITAVPSTANDVAGNYYWTPTAAQTQAAEFFSLYIKDLSTTIAFDENVITHYTGGNASARFSG